MNFANKISTFRILTVPFFFGCLAYYSQLRDYLRLAALGIFVLAVISDAVDGYIARKNNQQSKAGLVLDPLGDKLLLMSAFVSLALLPNFSLKFPLWVALVVISRDLIILMGALLIFIIKQNIAVFPSRWGKLTTTFQMSAVIAVLLQFKYAFIFWWLAVIFTVISGFGYIRKGFIILYAADNLRNNH